MNGFDITIEAVECGFRSYPYRMPLKFGREVSTDGALVRACVTVRGEDGRTACGFGETPLAAAWSWPAPLPQEQRVQRMHAFCRALAAAWREERTAGHPMEIGAHFLAHGLQQCLAKENEGRACADEMTYLAALVCCSAFDLAMYDAYGALHDVNAFDCFNARYMNRDLAGYYTDEFAADFAGKYPEAFFAPRGRTPKKLAACHLVGAQDPLVSEELTGEEPRDGIPVLLRDWIRTDGLFNLKIKLTGVDFKWDYNRIVRIGRMALENGVKNLTVDFNCTVEAPEYVCRMIDALKARDPEIYGRILYVEQPFAYDSPARGIDVHEVSARRLLMMDESAHDWRCVAQGHAQGWTGVALKTCKTLTGAVLSLCWARSRGMAVMVQDLTNPALAMVSHALLAANAGTIMGVEVNAMQFCPDASRVQAKVHPGLYKREKGYISLETLGHAGFGYRLDEMEETNDD